MTKVKRLENFEKNLNAFLKYGIVWRSNYSEPSRPSTFLYLILLFGKEVSSIWMKIVPVAWGCKRSQCTLSDVQAMLLVTSVVF